MGLVFELFCGQLISLLSLPRFKIKQTLKKLIFSLLMIVSGAQGQAQNLPKQLHDAHASFIEPALTLRRFKHRDLMPLIEKIRTNPRFEVTLAGKSLEERDIYLIKAGTGKSKVLLWSQMHGDEATATMAIMDIFRFLAATNDGFDALRTSILANTTLYFVPMLNPDGAERWQRRTAHDIDMNRDALRLQAPESVILKGLQQSLKPEFGFNLHDQSTRYSAGHTPNLATISFLATAYDYARSMNAVRERSTKLIVGMNHALQSLIPNQVGRYSDEHEPRAFGDNIQKWGTSLVLIESGGYRNDPEKQYIRKLNFVAILTGLKAIADGSYTKEKTSEYNNIPQNERFHFDLLIRNATMSLKGKKYTVDIGINQDEVHTDSTASTFTIKSKVEDLGDLSVFYGIEELDATGLEVVTEAGRAKAIKLGEVGTFGLRKDKETHYTIQNGRVKAANK